MADTKISALTAASTPLAGTEVLPIVQSGSTKKVAVSDLTAGRATSAASFVPTGSTVPANGVYLPATNTVAFATNTTERTRIDSNGQVGIGTLSPQRPLHVYYSTATVGGYTMVLQSSAGGYGAGISFQSFLSSTSTLAEMARITADGEAAWNTTASTQDAGLRFYTALDGIVAEKMRLDANGNQTLYNGNLIQGTAAKGVNFTANTGAAGMTSQLLNWYEEGTFTFSASATVANSVGTWPSSVTGNYTRIGNVVHIFVSIAGTNIGFDSLGGYYKWTGLPYTAGVGASAAISSSSPGDGVAAFGYVTGTDFWIYAPKNTNVTSSYFMSFLYKV